MSEATATSTTAAIDWLLFLILANLSQISLIFNFMFWQFNK